jgi:hypothetical protein
MKSQDALNLAWTSLVLSFVIAIVFAIVATAGCGTGPSPVPTTSTCATACARGSALSCIWATPTPMGASCEQVCSNADRIVPWNVACLTSASTCEVDCP